jgi:hypothetical protein
MCRVGSSLFSKTYMVVQDLRSVMGLCRNWFKVFMVGLNIMQTLASFFHSVGLLWDKGVCLGSWNSLNFVLNFG